MASLRARAFMEGLRTHGDVPPGVLTCAFGGGRGFHTISLFPFSKYHFNMSPAIMKADKLVGDELKHSFCGICDPVVKLKWNSL